MDKESIRKECLRLIECRNLKDSIDLLKIYQEFLFKVIVNQESNNWKSIIERDANILNQMIFSKTCYILIALQGVNYESSTKFRLNNIIDPTIIANLIRNVYETTCAFHLIYYKTINEEERTIVYNMWVISGLKNRQGFEKLMTEKANLEKLENERKEILDLENEIMNTSIFKNFSNPNKNKILNQLKNKDYKIVFEGNEVKVLNWKTAIQNFGFKTDIMDEVYAYFSLYAHPSNVSVFQFKDMFTRGENQFLEITNHNLSHLFIFLSVFIAEYIKTFPNTLEIFNSLELKDQFIIDFKNFFLRGEEYSINDSWKELE